MAITLSTLITRSATMMVLMAAGSLFAALHVAVAIFVRGQQLHADPHQQQRTDELEERQRQQGHGEGDQHHPQDDGTGGAPDDAPGALRRGSLRQASAITTALSPPSKMSMMMIWPSASQNSGEVKKSMKSSVS